MHFRIHAAGLCLGLILAVGTPASAQLLPKGLTCGLSYIDSGLNFAFHIGGNFLDVADLDTNNLSIAEDNVCNNVHTAGITSGTSMFPFPPGSGCNTCINGCNTVANACNPETINTQTPYANGAPGFQGIADGDVGNGTGAGYVHQEYLLGTDTPSDSSNFALPVGTACGFHNTQISPGRMCMGYQPSKAFSNTPENMVNPPGIAGCPSGWYPRRSFDMSSSAWFYVWCEYQDPNHLGTSGKALSVSGIACGISSNFNPDDPTGVNQGLNGACLGYDTLHGGGTVSTFCPGMLNSAFINSGESNNTGLGFCDINSNAIPGLSPTPVPRQQPFPPAPPPSGGVGTGCTNCKLN
jgi:hypothetical protein